MCFVSDELPFPQNVPSYFGFPACVHTETKFKIEYNQELRYGALNHHVRRQMNV
jgi:hypothetical protein